MNHPLETLHGAARVDLHVHTTRSDGRYAPLEVLRRCAAARLDVVALTDHDLASDLPAGPVHVDDRSVHLLHAAEVSGVHRGKEQHLLVYFPGQAPEGFRVFCRQRAQRRAVRYEEARARIGLPGVVPADEAALDGRRSLTRLHLAHALVAAGHAGSRREAFDRWTGDDAGAVPAIDLPLVEAIDVARSFGGVTSWAHPQAEVAQAWAGELARAGLHGLEGIRPGTGRRYRKLMKNLAAKHHLLLTGGSDWHGWFPGELGAFAMDGQQARPFLKALLAA